MELRTHTYRYRRRRGVGRQSKALEGGWIVMAGGGEGRGSCDSICQPVILILRTMSAVGGDDQYIAIYIKWLQYLEHRA